MKRAAVLASCLLFSGCLATQQDMVGLNESADQIKTQVSDLKKTLSSLQANQADLSLKMDQVRGDLSVFTENLKDNQDRMTRLSSKLDDLEAVLGQKVTALGDNLSKAQAAQLEATRASEQTALEAKKLAEEAAKKAAELEKPASGGGPTPSQVYHSAQVNLNKKRYDLASQGFSLYLKKYPRGEVADMATFYLGEAYYGSSEWESAARQYAIVLDKYPKSDITPSARLKYAMTLLNLKDKVHVPEAKRYLQSLQDDFPKAPETAQALKLLKKLEAPAPTPSKGKR